MDSTEDSSQIRPPLWKRFVIWCSRNWFYITLILLALAGIICAFYVPQNISGLEHQGNSVASVRQAILAVFAGALTMLTLWENHRKNTHEKNKNERDYNRQVHAERRSRYTKAVEQLASEKASVRLGGIYTLVGLADEWLADDNLNQDKRQEEGQVIINNLCAYIRSIPDGLTSIDLESGAAPSDEAKIRQTIFSEMSNRTNSGNRGNLLWADLKFDFSDSPIFYSLDDKVFMNADFQKSNFYKLASFSRSKFYGETKFTGSNFYIRSKFDKSEFHGTADFTSTRLGMPITTNADWKSMKNQLKETIRYASIPQNIMSTNYCTDFSEAFFEQTANFNKAYFYIKAIFELSNFSHEPDFDSSYFTCKEESNFSAQSNNIQLKVAELTDKSDNKCTQEIPIGAQLFDPKSWSSTEEKYTHVSNSEKPLNESNEAKKDKAE
ncbi:pentapeptide repeat-containing protein [uncultured Rothia sp.]|uniref:pentapeptide repeat-containing protein n=1 Tax=uncultured Rothia sp. TaxID=316088 RepID=UPI00288AA01A|nr:pentapeptide repeat-containing protein [uncultured Rothia sp.]